jgi:hypothetical protein
MSILYVASNWSNPFYNQLIAKLNRDGHTVLDWRRSGNDGNGFAWEKVAPDWSSWTPSQFVSALDDPAAEAAFCSDRDAIERADEVVLLLPAGANAHLESGFAVGRGKRLLILLPPDGVYRAELMYSWASRVCTSENELRAVIGRTDAGAVW